MGRDMEKQLMSAVASLVAVEKIQRTEGDLDEVCRNRMREALRIVAAEGGVAVAAAFIHWYHNGQVAPDPRRRLTGSRV